jgi:rRNA maturation protein Nop10
MALMKCPGCGGQTDDQAPACPHCGRSVNTQFGIPDGSTVCRNCGVMAAAGGTCPVCGAKLAGSPPARQSARTSLLIAIAVVILGFAVMVQSLCATSAK